MLIEFSYKSWSTDLNDFFISSCCFLCHKKALLPNYYTVLSLFPIMFWYHVYYLKMYHNLWDESLWLRLRTFPYINICAFFGRRKKCWKLSKLLQYIANKVQNKVHSHEILLTTQIILLILVYVYNHIQLRV